VVDFELPERDGDGKATAMARTTQSQRGTFMAVEPTRPSDDAAGMTSIPTDERVTMAVPTA
jgi:hypothetical protein